MTAIAPPRRHPVAFLSDAYGRAARSPFIRNVVQTFAARTFALSLSFVMSIIVSRALGPEGRGMLAVAVAASMLAVTMLTVGLHTANAYFAARDPSLVPRLLGNSLVSAVVLGLLGGSAAVVLLGFTGDGADLSVPFQMLILVSVPVGLAFAFLQNLLLGIGEVKMYNGTEVFNRGAPLVLLLAALAVWGGLSPQMVFLVTAAGTGLCVVFAYRRLAAVAGTSVRWDGGLLRSNLAYGFRTYISCVFSYLVLRVDVLIVGAILGPVPTGLYSVAVSAADLLFLLPAAAGALLLPKLAAMADRHEQWRATRRAALAIALVVSVPALVLALVSEPAVTLVYGADFAGAAGPLALLALAMVPYSINSMLAAYLAAIGSPYAASAVWGFGLAANIVANIVLVPAHGIGAAAAVSVATYSLVLVGNYWLARRSLA